MFKKKAHQKTPDDELRQYCTASEVPECQELARTCKTGEFIDCLVLITPCTVAAVKIGIPTLDELINSSIDCY